MKNWTEDKPAGDKQSKWFFFWKILRGDMRGMLEASVSLLFFAVVIIFIIYKILWQ